jgi:hypothetical protein
LREGVLQPTTRPWSPGQGGRRSSNGRADGGGPKQRGPRLERTRCASGPPGGTAQRPPRYRSYRRCRPQPPSSRRRAPRVGMRSGRRRRRALHRGMRSRRPPASDTSLYTAARCLARLPVSTQSKVKMFGTRDARFSQAARMPPTTRREQVSKTNVFPQFQLAAGLACGIFPSGAEKSRSGLTTGWAVDCHI